MTMVGLRIVFVHIRKIAKTEGYLRHICLSVRLPAWNRWAPNGQVFIKFDIGEFLKICRKKLRLFKI